mmetsp:Transcript_10987/g.16515  ORF Transcript_10987/g.16515 Transcript_10987/m.16515 type:complete len:692 (+) Transcript_10987:270-2345(+)|eukprot:CAMPEP_0196813358 /NCGR_PEP_ID=MMETSP1362-20130617/36099_1 /TAXON_ID=163516 /ORGANISM="Leptocylindrus danicus, Strain CCMP1856" /LENGTH=691 /DNA_ID=CAMNT_0042189557 /DNA_START=166 /DNA_END=2241 /DNA_ORIENTATION=+
MGRPVLLLQFVEDETTPQLIEYVIQALKDVKLEVKKESPNIISLSLSQEELEVEAEEEEMMKLMKSEELMEAFTVENRLLFVGAADDDEKKLFSYSEISFLTWSRMDKVYAEDSFVKVLEANSKLLGKRVKMKQFQHIEGEVIRHVLQDFDMLEILDVHSPSSARKVLGESMRAIWSPPLTVIRDYYGEEVAYYFSFVSFYLQQLAYSPALASVILYFVRIYRKDTIDTCTITPLFGVGMFIWAVTFLGRWRQQENRLAYQWGTFEQHPFSHKVQLRPDFEGELRVSPVTGKMVKYYPQSRRYFTYAFGFVVSMMLLSVAFFVMILSLNLQGYVHPKHDPFRWTSEEQHPFHYPFLSAMSEKGALFDVDTYFSLIPVVLHVIVIMTLNMIYRSVAEWLTELENHETEANHENSLIFKRFFFEACDAYFALFYLAFYERDITKLRGELVSVFLIDTFRRLGVECILPLVTQRLTNGPDEAAAKLKKKTDEVHPDNDNSDIIAQFKKDEYEIFDDYLEMVIQFGYITLFASAYPMGSFIAIFANMIEFRSDLFKLGKLCKKPRVLRTCHIGSWRLLISCIIWLSALTNCLIFGFTSQQMMEFLPGLFIIGSDGDQHFAEGKGKIVVMLVFTFERIMIITGVVIALAISAVPDDVKVKIERQSYLKEQEARKLQQELKDMKENKSTQNGRNTRA